MIALHFSRRIGQIGLDVFDYVVFNEVEQKWHRQLFSSRMPFYFTFKNAINQRLQYLKT
jgi:hypothetical protein